MADAQKMRPAIDLGRTRDKVRAPDFAAAPLGTDDEASGHTPQRDWDGPRKGDRIVDGDTGIDGLYKPRGEEDNRAPASAPPDWRTWGVIALGLAVLAVVMVGLS